MLIVIFQIGKMFFTNRNIFEVSTKHPDLRLVGCDGRHIPIHSILLIVNSNFLKSIFEIIDQSADGVFIVPDFSSEEL